MCVLRGSATSWKSARVLSSLMCKNTTGSSSQRPFWQSLPLPQSAWSLSRSEIDVEESVSEEISCVLEISQGSVVTDVRGHHWQQRKAAILKVFAPPQAMRSLQATACQDQVETKMPVPPLSRTTRSSKDH